jgi:VWFA-related protein
MNRRLAAVNVLIVLLAWMCPASASFAIQTQDAPRFRAGVALVPINAVVRDSQGRLVQDLGKDDFEVLENGRSRPIVDFRSTDRAPISLALLFDTSGSMRDGHLDQGKSVVDALLRRLDATSDEAALFTFDKALREETPFTQDADVIRAALDKTVAWGQTSLYDAISETAKRLAGRRS